MNLKEKLKQAGSWCGETHIQKTTYFLQNLFDVPASFNFILYKHGPYSFDLSDKITYMRAEGLVKIQPQSYPYGPSYVPNDRNESIVNSFSEDIEPYRKSVDYAAQRFGNKSVVELERLATALYVTLGSDEDGSVSTRAGRIHELKPHVELEEAEEAVNEVDQILDEANKL